MTKDIILEDRTNTLDQTNLRENKPKYIVMHATNSYPKFEDLLKKHKYQNKWKGVGYHIFLSDKGKIYQCRPFNLEGAHALGFNINSIGLGIYTKNCDLENIKINLGKGIISYLKKEFSQLQLIPHTLAQIIYLNRLLKENKLEKRFPENINCVDKSNFEKIKSDIEVFTGGLSTDSYGALKKSLKEFKNCPGELFNYFV